VSSLAKIRREGFEMAAFEGEVQFAQQGAAELPDDRNGLVKTRPGRVLFRQFGQAGENIQVGHDFVRNAGVFGL